MTNDAVINRKKIWLTEEESELAARFHKSRIAFAFVNHEIVYNEDKEDERDHMHWLVEDYHLNKNGFEAINRGYILKGKIVFYTGTDFKAINEKDISLCELIKMIEKHNQYFGVSTISVENGVQIGKVGKIWKPIKQMLIIKKIYH